MILTSVQETVALGSMAVELISTFRMVFPSFPVQIPVSLETLFANQENHVIDELALFKKVLGFQKLMVRIGKILHAKVVCWIAVVGKFSALWLVFVVFPAFV